MQQTEKFWNLINRIVLVAIIVMAAIGVMLAFTPKVKKFNQDQGKLDHLQQRIDVTMGEQRKYKDHIDRFQNDPDFVRKVAHEVGYASANETIYHFPEETGRF